METDRIGIPANGNCAACFRPSTVMDCGTTLCVRCAKEWQHGYGVGLVELTKKYVEEKSEE